MSFFDETDESRGAPRRRRSSPSRGGADDRALRIRQLVAGGVVLLVLILIVLGIKGCVSSSKKDGLRAYNRDVGGLIRDSDAQVGAPLFRLLSTSAGKSATDVQGSVNDLRQVADQEVSRAERLNVPDEVKPAQGNLLLALQLRRDGVGKIAELLQPALAHTAGASTALNQIAGQMRAFDASEVLYTVRVIPQVAKALDDAGIPRGGTGEPLQTTRFLPTLAWLDQTYVAGQLGGTGAAPGGKPAPGTHGHQLQSVSVGSTALQAGATTTLPSSPPPVFGVKFQNGGQNVETNVVVRVVVTPAAGGKPITVMKTVPRTAANQSVTAEVPLGRAPTPGQAKVSATVNPVPGEKSAGNNTQDFTVTFG